MNVKKFKAINFRNLNNIELELSDNINVIYGNNAQGKTNIIEGIWVFSGLKSFRNSKDFEMVNFYEKGYNLEIIFDDSERENISNIKFFDKKKILLNGVDQKNIKDLFGKFYCVLFYSDHLSIVKDGPKERRKFLNNSISQINPRYNSYLVEYQKILNQRNYLIKNNYKYKSLIKQNIDVWDIQLSKIGSMITIQRYVYLEKIKNLAKDIYLELSNYEEIINLEYVSTIFGSNIIKKYEKETVEFYYNKLKANFESDLKFGYTTLGVHKDDMDIYINKLKAKDYASQGQQRSLLISIKLAEAKIIKIETDENPIILLDDVMSELDNNRQNYILNNLKNFQVIITCCDIMNTLNLKNGKLFKISGGKLEFEKNI